MPGVWRVRWLAKCLQGGWSSVLGVRSKVGDQDCDPSPPVNRSVLFFIFVAVVGALKVKDVLLRQRNVFDRVVLRGSHPDEFKKKEAGVEERCAKGSAPAAS